MKAPSELPKPRTDLLRSAEPSLGVGQDRADLAGEGADLVADRARSSVRRAARWPSAPAPAPAPAGSGRAAPGGPPWRRCRRWRRPIRPALRVEGNSVRISWIELLLVGEVAERALGGGDEAFDLGVVAAQFGGQQAEVVDHVGERDAACGDRPVEVGDVVGEGLQAAQGAPRAGGRGRRCPGRRRRRAAGCTGGCRRRGWRGRRRG